MRFYQISQIKPIEPFLCISSLDQRTIIGSAPVATMIAIGVARPSVQRHRITTTEIENVRAKSK
ncbi:hypothetical protein HanIR_Chr16g0804091 [Helianthus annuus]|nr:hypothetical protein HanIR_Chr16g0804091 [Helianthus annuus]